MNLTPLKILWSACFDHIGHYDRQLNSLAGQRLWFIPMYHRILRDDQTDPFDLGLGVSKRHFDEHLTFFRERFHVCTVQEGLRIQEDGDWPDRPLLSITFDDGYLDNIDLALPLLKQHGCPATFFICTGPIAENLPFWWDLAIASAAKRNGAHWQSLLTALRLASERHAKSELLRVLGHLWDLDYGKITSLLDMNLAVKEGLDQHCPPRMQKHHVKSLADHQMEIAAHTHHHPNLTKESEPVIEQEIVRSRTILEDWTGQPISGFAPPHGLVDDRVKTICSKQEMAYIASTDRGANRDLKPYHLARFGIADAGLATLKRSLSVQPDLA
ncbi:MAG: polysaccharide deacetylase family protein [Geminicoccaceae bacterium]